MPILPLSFRRPLPLSFHVPSTVSSPKHCFPEAPQVEQQKENPKELGNHLIVQVPFANWLKSFYEQIWWLSFGK